MSEPSQGGTSQGTKEQSRRHTALLGRTCGQEAAGGRGRSAAQGDRRDVPREGHSSMCRKGEGPRAGHGRTLLGGQALLRLQKMLRGPKSPAVTYRARSWQVGALG